MTSKTYLRYISQLLCSFPLLTACSGDLEAYDLETGEQDQALSSTDYQAYFADTPLSKADIAKTSTVLQPALLGEYGDAPDGDATGYPYPLSATGAFPTRATSDGFIALSALEVVLGRTASLEFGVNDPADPDQVTNLGDGDSDDGLIGIATVAPGKLSVNVRVSAPESSESSVAFFNALIDVNGDGQWDTDGERVASDRVLQLSPGQEQTLELPINSASLRDQPGWLRLAVSTTPLGEGWTGGGTVDAGEVEDYIIDLPRVQPALDPGLVIDLPSIPTPLPTITPLPTPTALPTPPNTPPVGATCNMACEPGVELEPGKKRDVSCSVTGTSGSFFEYELTKKSGGVLLSSPLSPAPGVPNLPLSTGIIRFSIEATAPDGASLPSEWEYEFTCRTPESRGGTGQPVTTRRSILFTRR